MSKSLLKPVAAQSFEFVFGNANGAPQVNDAQSTLVLKASQKLPRDGEFFRGFFERE